MTEKVKREYFSFPFETEQFDKALTSMIADLSRAERAKIIPEDNVMRYSHGIKWVSVSSSSPDEESEMSTHSTETTIKFDDIKNHNLNALPEFLKDIVDQMHNAFQRTMYQTVSEACDKSGNSVSQKDHETSADAFLATLKKIEFGVDKEGKVSRPEFHVGPQAFEAFKRDAKEKGEEFQEKIDKVIEEKSAEALAKEQKRLESFRVE